MKYFRVKFGFDKNDFYSIDENDLPKALRAQVNGTIFVCDEGTISPDYNRKMGYKRDYALTGEDYDEIGAEAVNEHRLFLNEVRRVAIGGAPATKQISDGTH